MKLKLLSLALIATLTLNGCANQAGDGYDYSKADPSITQDEVNFFSKSGYQACAIGAFTGVAACLISNSSDKLACAAIAAVGGCLVLMGSNYVLDDVRTKYKQKEDQLNAISDLVKKDSDRLKKLNAKTKTLIEREKKEIAKIQSESKKGVKDADVIKKKLDDVNNNIAYLEKSKEKYEEQLKTYSEVRDGLLVDENGKKVSLNAEQQKKKKALEQDINNLKKEIDSLKSTLLTYSKQRTILTEVS